MNALNVNQNLQNLDECEESPKTWKEKELVKEVGHQMHQQFQPLKGKLATLVTRM